MDQRVSAASFIAPLTRSLRKHGIKGETRVSLTGNTLQIAGSEGGVLMLMPSRVRRLRAGWEETKYGPSHETRIWLDQAAKPIVLHLKERHAIAAYAAAIHGFAAEMGKAGALGRVEIGTTKAGSLFLPIAFGLLSTVALGISLFVITEEPWWGRMLVPIVPIGVFLYSLRMMQKSWPRPTGDIASFVQASIDHRYLR